MKFANTGIGKRCIFCGEPPKDKNLEHILPLWLIEHTGDPNRVVYHGVDFAIGRGPPRLKRFAFDQFRFPACSLCNTKWSALEDIVREVVNKLENKADIDATELNALLDWFDKVRVGIWLSRLIDRSSISQIDPKFFIDQRVGASDRLLYISRGSASDGLTSIGVGSAKFSVMPSVFALRVNGLMFFNVSSTGLFSGRLGFPQLIDKPVRIDGLRRYLAEVIPGKERRLSPVTFLPYPLEALKIYQPMYRYLNSHHNWQNHFRTQYVLDNSLNWSLGEGSIFEDANGLVEKLECLSEAQHRRMDILTGTKLRDKVMRAVAIWQTQLSRSGVRGDILTPERKEAYRATLAKARRLDKKLGI